MFKNSRMIAIVLAFALLFAASVFAKGNDVHFFGTVLSVTMESSTHGVMNLRLMGFPVAIRLNGDTEVEAHGDEAGLRDLKVGDFVKVSGFFANSAITATEIEIVDRGDGEFRLRGPITAVRPATGGATITVLGTEVDVNAETKIEPRGPNDGFTAASLAAGMFVDTRGHWTERRFVATRVKVGLRENEAIRVDFAGRITAVETRRLVLDTEGGSAAVVLITTGTTVLGTPAAGKFADVRGTLNSNLEVVATRIIIKSNRDDDDHPAPHAAVEFKKEISLTPVPSTAAIRGEVGIEIETDDGRLHQEFELEVKRAEPNTEYRIVVTIGPATQAALGTFRTNSEGSAEVKIRTLSTLLPAGKTVRDIVSIQILRGSTVVLQGTL